MTLPIRPLILAGICLLCMNFLSLAHADDSTTLQREWAEDLVGEWIMAGPYNQGQSCHIKYEDGILTLINEFGSKSRAHLIDENTLIAEAWEGGLKMTLSSNRQLLISDKGTWGNPEGKARTWIKKSALKKHKSHEHYSKKNCSRVGL